jgi:hypothetical protein
MGISFWLPLLLTLLGYVLKWLLEQDTLTERRRKQLNAVIYRARELERVAVRHGCTEGGELEGP